jgi:hypothetical protein
MKAAVAQSNGKGVTDEPARKDWDARPEVANPKVAYRSEDSFYSKRFMPPHGPGD